MDKTQEIGKYLRGVNVEGNIIPIHWFKIIGEKNRYGQFKANLLAINIMAEILYWYRPIIERDSDTGFEKGVRMKFSGDKYQFAYRHIKEKFGVSKKSAKSACDLLVSINAISREFRNETIRSVKYSNVMYVEPVLQWLIDYVTIDKGEGVPPKTVARYLPKRGQGTTQNSDTNTEITTETTTEKEDHAPLPLGPKMFEPKKQSKVKPKGVEDQEVNHILNIMRQHDKGFNRTQEIIKLIKSSIKDNGFEETEQAVLGRLMVKRNKEKSWRWLFLGNSDFIDALGAYEKENAAESDMQKRWTINTDAPADFSDLEKKLNNI